MRVIYTDQSFESLEEVHHFLLEDQDIPLEKVNELTAKILDKADSLVTTYNQYQEEEHLKHMGRIYRRAIEGYIKIIYRVEDDKIFIVDFFDSRQDPAKMKG